MRGAVHTWTPPQQGPTESDEHYIKVLEGKIERLWVQETHALRDKAMVIRNRIKTCDTLIAKVKARKA